LHFQEKKRSEKKTRNERKKARETTRERVERKDRSLGATEGGSRKFGKFVSMETERKRTIDSVAASTAAQHGRTREETER